MTRKLSRPLHIFLVHAGLQHRADFPECFSTLTSHFNAAQGFEFTVILVMHVVDLRPMRPDNVLDSLDHREELLIKLATGDGILIAVPSYSTFSRARHSSSEGPRPVRDSTWQWGKPQLLDHEAASVDFENRAMDFCLEALACAAKANMIVYFEAPEDLGRASRSTPATVWRWPMMQVLSQDGVARGAVRQCDWAEGLGLRPSGILTNANRLTQHAERTYLLVR